MTQCQTPPEKLPGFLKLDEMFLIVSPEHFNYQITTNCSHVYSLLASSSDLFLGRMERAHFHQMLNFLSLCSLGDGSCAWPRLGLGNLWPRSCHCLERPGGAFQTPGKLVLLWRNYYYAQKNVNEGKRCNYCSVLPNPSTSQVKCSPSHRPHTIIWSKFIRVASCLFLLCSVLVLNRRF